MFSKKMSRPTRSCTCLFAQYITLRYIASHYLSLHYSALHCMALRYITVHCMVSTRIWYCFTPCYEGKRTILRLCHSMSYIKCDTVPFFPPLMNWATLSTGIPPRIEGHGTSGRSLHVALCQKGGRERGREEARRQGGKEARRQGGKEARRQRGKEARSPGAKEPRGHALSAKPREPTSRRVIQGAEEPKGRGLSQGAKG